MKKIIFLLLALLNISNAQQYNVILNSSDSNGSSLSFIKNIGGVDFTFSAESYLGFQTGDNGLYGYSGSGNEFKIELTIESGYTFDLNQLDALSYQGSMTFDLTYSDNSTSNFTVNTLNISEIQTVNTVGFPINDVKKIAFISSEYSVIQNLVFNDIKTILPVELTSFTSIISESSVILSWSTAIEVNNYGFEIQRAIKGTNDNCDFTRIGFVMGNGNSNSPKNYKFTDSDINTDLYLYRLKQIDNNGQYEFSDIIEVNTSNIPSEFSLSQNYPNPFNPSTTISFNLPNNAFVTLKIYDILGREITTLVNEELNAGHHTKVFNATNLSSGVYFYKLQAGKFSETKKMMLVR